MVLSVAVRPKGGEFGPPAHPNSPTFRMIGMRRRRESGFTDIWARVAVALADLGRLILLDLPRLFWIACPEPRLAARGG
jgi:hypothetical protein